MPASETLNRSNPLLSALLLATTGGLLDAVVYLNHGHVFANAMTGNVIFLGIEVLGRNWSEIAPRLVPLAGFIAGVTASKHMRSRYSERTVLLLGLTFEAAALFGLGWLPPSFPHMPFTAIIAFVSAFQVASYRRVERFSYNSTFVTGNLRDLTEGFMRRLRRAPPLRRGKRVWRRLSTLGLSACVFFAELSWGRGLRLGLGTTRSGSPNRFY